MNLILYQIIHLQSLLNNFRSFIKCPLIYYFYIFKYFFIFILKIKRKQLII